MIDLIVFISGFLIGYIFAYQSIQFRALIDSIKKVKESLSQKLNFNKEKNKVFIMSAKDENILEEESEK